MAALQVYPGASHPSHELSLSDGVLTWGLHLQGGAAGIKETLLTPSGLRLNWVSGFGAWEPGLAQIEQRDWSGGRGVARFSTQTARHFFDSQNAWTLTPGRVHAAPQWSYAQGLRHAVQRLPGDLSWQALLGEQRSLAAAFSVGAEGLAAKHACVWLRRVGSPGELSVQLHADAAGQPGAVLPNSASQVTVTEITDVVSQWRRFDVSGYSTPLSAGSYHLAVRGAASDNASNHWEIGVERRAPGGQRAAADGGWHATSFRAYYRIEDNDLDRRFLFFWLDGALYAADQRADGSPSHLYLNGARGVASSASATSLSDANALWPADQWAGAWVYIHAGAGAGQLRQIVGNNDTQLQVAAWQALPDASSQYLITATPHWQDISPSSGDTLNGSVSDVAVMNGQALLALGASLPLLRMRFNPAATPPAHEFDADGSNAADLLHIFQHAEFGPQVWRGLAASAQISRAQPSAWLTPLSFATPIQLGGDGLPLLRLFDFNGQLCTLKADSLWQLERSEHVQRQPLGLPRLPRHITPSAQVWNDALWLGWGSQLLATGGSGLKRFGPGQGEGLPPGRAGQLAALLPLGAHALAVAQDAGRGHSSVLVWDGTAWHELLRAPRPAAPLRSLALQPGGAGMPAWLWVECGGDLLWLPLPAEGENPLGDAGMRYQHEGVLVGSSIDMEATLLPKFLTQLSLVSRNLGEGAQVALDFQLDAEIGGPSWRQAGSFYSSPVDRLTLNTGELFALRPRLRLLSQRAATPAIVEATLLDGFARTPQKYQWELQVRLDALQLHGGEGLDAAPQTFLAWLRQAARSATRLRLRAMWAGLDDSYVIVDAPSLQRAPQGEGGVALVRIREG
ncbi:MAG: hypothetical protein KF821_09485 [Anaerolineales bacterium]|nr:hypothetical protein [Anaerolineales bacterium]